MSKHAIQCWNCGTRLTLDERSENDGDCIECGVELALDDYFDDALTDRDELRAQVEAMRALLTDARRYVDKAWPDGVHSYRANSVSGDLLRKIDADLQAKP